MFGFVTKEDGTIDWDETIRRDKERERKWKKFKKDLGFIYCCILMGSAVLCGCGIFDNIFTDIFLISLGILVVLIFIGVFITGFPLVSDDE